jgi:hypothetical protein
VALTGGSDDIHDRRLLANVLLEHSRLRAGGIWDGLPPVVINELLPDLVGGERQRGAGIVALLDGRNI